MCWLFVIFLLQVTYKYVTPYPAKDYIMAYIPVEELASLSSSKFEVIPIPYYGCLLLDEATFPVFRPYYLPSPGPVFYGGQVRGRGGVRVTGGYGNQGYGTFPSYSAPSSPVVITTPATVPAKPLPIVTALPEVTLPYEVFVPPIITVPGNTMPITVGTNTISQSLIESCGISVVSDVEILGNVGSDAGLPVAGNIKYGGTVPASGRVKICATFR